MPFSIPVFLTKKERKTKKQNTNVHKICLLKRSFWNMDVLWIFWSICDPRICFQGRCHLQACNDFEYQLTISAGIKAAVVWNGHKVAAVLPYQIWLLGPQSLNGSRVLDWNLEWSVPGESPSSLSHYFLFVFLIYVFYFLLQRVWLQCLACCRCGRCGSFTHIQMSVLPGILFPCTLWQNVE